MNFCFSVCEYDPLHNGHVYHINQMKKSSEDVIAVFMSGNFTQRGDIAILDKYTRAKHAILAGADVVFELPTVFATAPAQIFASGAIKLMSSLGKNNSICFGCENGSRDEFLSLASACNNETREFKEVLKRELENGSPYALARTNALKATAKDVNLKLLETPNSILGLEYTKAILAGGSDINIVPIPRAGNGFNDNSLEGTFCSSSAIRGAISQLKTKKVKKFVPNFVFRDLPEKLPDISQQLIYSLLLKKSSEIRETLDCSEGLENRIKVVARSARNFTELIDRLETKRYTRARLSRVVLSTMLGITRKTVEKSLTSNLYLKVLAIAKDKTEILTELNERLSSGKVKLITRKSDADSLSGIAEECFNIDVFANDVFNLATNYKSNEFDMKIIER